MTCGKMGFSGIMKSGAKYIVSSLVILLLLITVACDNNRHSGGKDSPGDPGRNDKQQILEENGAAGPKEEVEIDENTGKALPEISDRPEVDLESTSATAEDIAAVLSQRDDVYAVTWSPDGTAVAFVLGDVPMAKGRVYFWFSGDHKPKLLGDARDVCYFYWSPDNQYLLVDMGTSAYRGGIIFSIDRQKEIGLIRYTFYPLWSPDARFLALGVVREDGPSILWELGGTVNLVLYNVETGDMELIAEGSAEFFYHPIEWKSDGTLIYEKNWFNEKVERLEYPYP